MTVLKEKYASKVEELDVLRVEIDEMKSGPSLLSACTSCPVLHEKLDVSLVYARSLEAQLKAPIPTSCSTCEINAVKNIELAHYVDRLQDENDELSKMMGWLSGHEPQLRMMIEAYKRYDGQVLGSDKVGERSGENEGKIGDIPEPPKSYHKNAYAPKTNPLRNRLDTTPAPPVFPPQSDNFQKPIKFKSDLGNEFFEKKGEKLSEEKPQPRENPKPKPKSIPFHCDHCGKDGHLAEFCFRRKCEERLTREMANKDRYRPSRGVPEPRLVPRGEGVVRTIYPRERREFVPRGEPPHREGGRRVGFGHGEFAGCSFARGQYEYGETIATLGPRGAMGHGLPFVVRVVLHGNVWVFHLGEIRWILLTPRLSKWHDAGLIRFVLTPVLSRLLTLTLIFYVAGGRHGGLLVYRLWLLSTHDRRSKVVLKPHPGDDQRVHHFWGQQER
jgi:hypothetical protein